MATFQTVPASLSSTLITSHQFISKTSRSTHTQQQHRTKKNQIKSSSSRHMASSSRDMTHVTRSASTSNGNRGSSQSSYSGSSSLRNGAVPKKRGRKPAPGITPEVARAVEDNRKSRLGGLQEADRCVKDASDTRILANQLNRRSERRLHDLDNDENGIYFR